MTDMNESIAVGQEALVKVAGRIIPATVEEILPDGWMVKSIASGKTFKTRKLLGKPSGAAGTGAEQHREAAPRTPCARKMSLLDAAAEVLRLNDTAMNTREMVRQAIERGLWIQTKCRTPEQSLYGAIFQEIKSGKSPRFRKSDRRGAFELT